MQNRPAPELRFIPKFPRVWPTDDTRFSFMARLEAVQKLDCVTLTEGLFRGPKETGLIWDATLLSAVQNDKYLPSADFIQAIIDLMEAQKIESPKVVRPSYANLGVKTITIRPKSEITNAFNELCDALDIPTATVVRYFIENCVDKGTIPFDILPQKEQNRLKDGLKRYQLLSKMINKE